MKLHILIADDHGIVRRGLKELLLEEFPTAIIEEAENADELLRLSGQKKWDLVISDINMPGRSGIDALHQIRHEFPGIPVLIMSMYSEDQYALRAFKAGAAGYLAKETVHYNLAKAVKDVLSGKKFITPAIAEKMAGFLGEESTKQPHEQLSNREFEVFKLLTAGKSATAIAELLAVSTTTVSTYRARILDKMKMQSNADLIRYAVEKNLT